MKSFKNYLIEESIESAFTGRSEYTFMDTNIPISLNKSLPVDKFNPKKLQGYVKVKKSKHGVEVTILHYGENSLVIVPNTPEFMQDQIKTKVFVDLINTIPTPDGHGEALKKTGFWGAQGAGAIVKAQDTGRFLLVHRKTFDPKSRKNVQEPGTWGIIGGAIDKSENPEKAVLREMEEEAGYKNFIGKPKLLYTFQKGSFKYFNYLLISEKEFVPKLDWENDGYKWCELGNFPSPLHFGVKSLLNQNVLE